MKQFATLAWKEWRQLRGVRWFSVLLGALLLLILMASTRVGQPGEPNAFGFRTPDPEQIAFDAAPLVFAALLWPLACLLTGVQAFTGDKTIRCGEFLMLLPVSRSKTWLARLLVCASSFAVSVAASGLLLVGLALLVGGSEGLSRFWVALGTALLAQLLVLPLALAGATAAAALGLTSFAALGLALAIGLFVAAMAVWLSGALVLVRASLWPWYGAAFALPPTLGLLGSALWTTVRAEPAGNSSWKRALPLVLASILLPPLAYVGASAPLVERGERRSMDHRFEAAGSGDLAVELGRGAFIVDARSARRIEYLQPFVWGRGASLRSDGRRIAIVHDPTVSGLMLSTRSVLNVYDEEGALIHQFDESTLGCHPLSPAWVGDELLLDCYANGKSPVVSVNLEDGTSRVVSEGIEGYWMPAGRDALGRDLLCIGGRSTEGEWGSRLFEYRPDEGAISEEPLTRVGRQAALHCRWGLAPGGRYYAIDGTLVYDLLSAEELELPPSPENAETRPVALLAGDRLLRSWYLEDEALTIGLELVDIETRVVTSFGPWTGNLRPARIPSPDQRRVLITLLGFDEGLPPRWTQVQTLLLDADSGDLVPLPVEAFDWAGPDTLVVREEGRLALWRVGDPPEATRALH